MISSLAFQKLTHLRDEKVIALKQRTSKHAEGWNNPIVFCRFSTNCGHVSDSWQNDKKFKNIHIEGLTGRLNPDERVRRIEQMTTLGDVQKILVATDCLAEGINLQDNFNAVIHLTLHLGAQQPTNREKEELIASDKLVQKFEHYHWSD